MPVIVAKMDGQCQACGLSLSVGERIHWTRKTGALHLACVEDAWDPEEDIVAKYTAWRAQGLTDEQAFDDCVTEYRYVDTVKALYRVSPLAKAREDAYRARQKSRVLGGFAIL